MAGRWMTIGELSRETGATPRAIRYYERLGLIPRAKRTPSNYRLFDGDAVERIRLIARCRSLEFPIVEIAALTEPTQPHGECAHTAAVVRHHLELVDEKMRTLARVRGILERRLAECGDERVPECPLLEFLRSA